MEVTMIAKYVLVLALIAGGLPKAMRADIPFYNFTPYDVLNYSGTLTNPNYTPWVGAWATCSAQAGSISVGGSFRWFISCPVSFANNMLAQWQTPGTNQYQIIYSGTLQNPNDNALQANFYAYANCSENNGDLVVENDYTGSCS
jgi:hypothetical protein